MNDSDKGLLEGLKAGRIESFEQLVRNFSGRLMVTATRILGSSHDAEDTLQEALVSAWKAIGQFDGASSLYTWLHRIVVNACLSRLRAAKAKSEVSLGGDGRAVDIAFEGIPTAWSEPGPSLEKRLAMRRAIERALRLIPEDLRTVLLLRDVEELSSREVAEAMGINDAAVRQRLHRARTAMAEILRPELCDEPALTCGGQLDLLLDYIDNALSAELQGPVHQHIEGCEACSHLLKTYRMTIGVPRAIVELTGPIEPGERFVGETLARVRD